MSEQDCAVRPAALSCRPIDGAPNVSHNSLLRLGMPQNDPALAGLVHDSLYVLVGFAALQKSSDLPVLAEADLEEQDVAGPQLSRRVLHHPHMHAKVVGTCGKSLARLQLKQVSPVSLEAASQRYRAGCTRSGR